MSEEQMIGIELMETGIRVARMVQGKIRVLYEEQWPYKPLYERFETENFRQPLEECKNYFEELGLAVNECLVSVPVGLDYNQREKVRAVFSEAGFTPVRILSNISLMALAYGFANPEDDIILLIDMRDNFTDIGVAQIGDEVVEMLMVREVPGIGLKDSTNMIIEQKQKLAEMIKKTLRETEIRAKDIGKVVLSENCTNQTAFKEICESLTSQKKWKIMKQKYGTLRGLVVQAAKLSGVKDAENILLLDVLPWSIAVGNRLIAAEDEERHEPSAKMYIMLERGFTLPTRESKIFEVRGNKGSVRVFQDGDKNKQIAEIPMPDWVKDSSKVEVTVDVDANVKIEIILKDPEGLQKRKEGINTE